MLNPEMPSLQLYNPEVFKEQLVNLELDEELTLNKFDESNGVHEMILKKTPVSDN